MNKATYKSLYGKQFSVEPWSIGPDGTPYVQLKMKKERHKSGSIPSTEIHGLFSLEDAESIAHQLYDIIAEKSDTAAEWKSSFGRKSDTKRPTQAHRLVKRAPFSAAHSIAGAGKCANKHGHNWVAEIEVQFVGQLDHRGFIADVAEIKNAATKYDHDDLDKYFTFASTENVAQKIANDVLQTCFVSESRGDYEVSVHLIETENNSATAYASSPL